MVITRDKNQSPDMILTAFELKFNKKQKKTGPVKKAEKNNVEKVDPQKVKRTKNTICKSES